MDGQGQGELGHAMQNTYRNNADREESSHGHLTGMAFGAS